MGRRFAACRDQLLADAEVDPRIPRGVSPRLERFLDPFVERPQRSEPGGHARRSVAGLLSDLPYQNVESIAYFPDQEREPLQQFIGPSPWDHGPWLAELARQVGRELGGPDGVLVLDPSAFPKKGDASVGVQRHTRRSAYMRRTARRRLRRIEEARFYRWKTLNRLPPLRVGQQE